VATTVVALVVATTVVLAAREAKEAREEDTMALTLTITAVKSSATKSITNRSAMPVSTASTTVVPNTNHNRFRNAMPAPTASTTVVLMSPSVIPAHGAPDPTAVTNHRNNCVVTKTASSRAAVAMVARVAKEEKVDTMVVVALVDTEALVDMVARVGKAAREVAVVVSSFKNVLPYVHSHHHPVIQVRTVKDLENTVVVVAKEQLETLLISLLVGLHLIPTISLLVGPHLIPIIILLPTIMVVMIATIMRAGVITESIGRIVIIWKKIICAIITMRESILEENIVEKAAVTAANIRNPVSQLGSRLEAQ